MLEIMFYVMGILLSLGLFAKLISSITVRKMVKEAAEIQKSNHKLIKLIKAKFEHASMISERMQNVGAFVDKYIYEYKVFGIRLNTWREIPRKIFLLILILGVFSVCESIRLEGLATSTVECIQWTSLSVLVLALVNFMSGESARLEATRNYIVEYLENVCIHRYAKQYVIKEKEQSMEEIKEREIQVNEPMEETAPEQENAFVVEAVAAQGVTQKEEPKLQIVEKLSEEEERSQQEMRIRAILEEFLA